MIIFGFMIFHKNLSLRKRIPNSTVFLGIFLPLLIALFYSETVIELIPQITMIDLGAFFIIGMITGFFLSILLMQRNTTLVDN
jgi:hypothetical protein